MGSRLDNLINTSIIIHLFCVFVNCVDLRGTCRTLDQILEELTTLNMQGLLPDLSFVAGFQKQDSGDEKGVEGSELAA